MRIKELAKSLLGPGLRRLRSANVMMFHIGRCGSTVVGELLREHPRVYWASELYSAVFREWKIANHGVEVRGEMPENAVDLLRRDMLLALHRNYGAEMKPFHFRLIGYEMGDFIGHLDDLGFTHYVILDRRNRLRKIISSVIAHQSPDSYHLASGEKPALCPVRLNTERIEIDFASKPLLDFLSDYEHQLTELRAALGNRATLELTYEEDIQDDPRRAYRRICRFLGLKPHDASVSLARTNPFPIRRLVENYAEVSALLADTQHAWMLHE